MYIRWHCLCSHYTRSIDRDSLLIPGGCYIFSLVDYGGITGKDIVRRPILCNKTSQLCSQLRETIDGGIDERKPGYVNGSKWASNNATGKMYVLESDNILRAGIIVNCSLFCESVKIIKKIMTTNTVSRF